MVVVCDGDVVAYQSDLRQSCSVVGEGREAWSLGLGSLAAREWLRHRLPTTSVQLLGVLQFGGVAIAGVSTVLHIAKRKRMGNCECYGLYSTGLEERERVAGSEVMVHIADKVEATTYRCDWRTASETLEYQRCKWAKKDGEGGGN